MAEAAQGAAPRTSGSVPRASGSSPRARVRDAERTRGELLAVAIDEFTRHGLAGARVDEIAARTRTTKRMIYYYFGSKEGLYTAALEEVYAGIRAYERSLDLTGLEPAAALRELAGSSFDYHVAHPELARLVGQENLMGAVYLHGSERQAHLNRPILAIITDLLERGRAAGVVRRPVSAIEVHLFISSWVLFQVANVSTIRATFGYDMTDDAVRARHRELIGDALLDWLGGGG